MPARFQGQQSASSAYQRVAEIASGGMGIVELVVRREGRFERRYARKRLHRQFRDDPAFRTSFMDEARLAGLVRHPNVVGVLDVGEDRAGPFLIMDFVEGFPLSRLIEEAARMVVRLPVQLCVRIAVDAARGLHAVHEARGPDGQSAGLVHRDISPHNLLLGFDGTVRVTDFGIAKALAASTRTGTGVLKGTVGYLAPEQLRFEEPDRRSDLFSLGVCLYELLSGVPLYPNDGDLDGARRILAEPAPSIEDVRDDVPLDLTDLLIAMLAKERDARPHSAQEVGARLETILASLVQTEGVVEVVSTLQATFGPLCAQERQRLLPGRGTGRPDAPVRGLLVAGGVAAVLAIAVVVTALRAPSNPGSALIAGQLVPDIWSGPRQSCMLEAGSLSCWGRNDEGQLTGGHRGALVSPTPFPLPGLRNVALGLAHGCACSSNGAVHCWGQGASGQLGLGGSVAAVPGPLPLPGITACVTVAAGDEHTCVLLHGGGVQCWGRNDRGQIPSAPPPAAVELHAAGHFGCVRQGSGAVWCWGDNSSGQLGDGRRDSRSVPAPVQGQADAVSLALGRDSACAIKRSGGVSCWGRLARASIDGMTGVVQLTVGAAHACAVTGAGKLRCWGSNRHGQLGDGTGRDGVVPVEVVGLGRVQAVSAGAWHTCARHAGGIACWGRNQDGQVGDSSTEDRFRPVSVSGLTR